MSQLCPECSKFTEFSELAEAKDNNELIILLKYIHLRVNGPTAEKEIDPLDFERMKAIVCVLNARGICLPKATDTVNIRLLGPGMLTQYVNYIRDYSFMTDGLTKNWSEWFHQLLLAEINRREYLKASEGKEINNDRSASVI